MKRAFFVLMMVLTLGMAACKPEATPTTAAKPSIQVSNAWMRPVVKDGDGGAFMIIKNSGGQADKLVRVMSSVAMMNEVHEMRMVGDVMTMSPVPSLEIPAKGQVELKSGGYHVMMMKVMQEIKAGDTVSLTLTFEKAGDITVSVSVHN